MNSGTYYNLSQHEGPSPLYKNNSNFNYPERNKNINE